MARLVKKEDKFPFEIKVGEESIWMCMCGLSNNQPCDESHKVVADEDNRTYAYDKERKRTEVRDWDILV
ncbi:MAG: CDGSH iron-sulfur domain-containing protein [Candidatus Nitrosopolaris sp.]|jgi:CDGSH-type Zn-finger protein